MIDEIAERTGRDWCVLGNTFSMWSAATGSVPGAEPVITITDGDGRSSRSPRGRSATAPTSVTVRGWDPVAQSAVVGTADTPTSRAGFDATTGGGTEVHAGRRPGGDPVADRRHTSPPPRIAARTGRVTATGRVPVHRAAGSRRTARRSTGPDPRTGTTTSARSTTRAWTATRSRGFVVGDRDPVQLSDPWETSSPVSSFKRSGLAVGIVDNVQDPDGPGPRAGLAEHGLRPALQRVGPGARHRRGRQPRPGRHPRGRRRGAHRLRGRRRHAAGGARRAVRQQVHDAHGRRGRRQRRRGDARADVAPRAHADDERRHDARPPSTSSWPWPGSTTRCGSARTAPTSRCPPGVPLKITVGSSFIEFDGNGNITIDATKITIKATAKVEVSGGEVEAKATGGAEAAGHAGVAQGHRHGHRRGRRHPRGQGSDGEDQLSEITTRRTDLGLRRPWLRLAHGRRPHRARSP